MSRLYSIVERKLRRAGFRVCFSTKDRPWHIKRKEILPSGVDLILWYPKSTHVSFHDAEGVWSRIPCVSWEAAAILAIKLARSTGIIEPYYADDKIPSIGRSHE